jgi:hypothetical protein
MWCRPFESLIQRSPASALACSGGAGWPVAGHGPPVQQCYQYQRGSLASGSERCILLPIRWYWWLTLRFVYFWSCRANWVNVNGPLLPLNSASRNVKHAFQVSDFEYAGQPSKLHCTPPTPSTSQTSFVRVFPSHWRWPYSLNRFGPWLVST